MLECSPEAARRPCIGQSPSAVQEPIPELDRLHRGEPVTLESVDIPVDLALPVEGIMGPSLDIRIELRRCGPPMQGAFPAVLVQLLGQEAASPEAARGAARQDGSLLCMPVCSTWGSVRCKVQPVLLALGADSIVGQQAPLLGLTMPQHDAASRLVVADTRTLQGAVRPSELCASACLLRAQGCCRG